MLDEKMIVEAMARAIMVARDNGGCAVKNWEQESRDNPHVSQAYRQAQAAYRTALKLIGVGLAEELRQDTSLRAAGAAGTNTALRCASRIRALTSGE